MTVKRFLRLVLLGGFASLYGSVGAPVGISTAWATSHEKTATKPMAQPSRMEKKPAMGTPATPAGQLVPMQPPRTLEEYMKLVRTKLEFEAAKIKQPGTADLKLTIGKDGSVKHTDIGQVDGPATLREQILPMVSRIAPLPPLPPDANADVLVVRTSLAFNYPGGELLDAFGQGSRRDS
jgi:hypothetical protein